MAAPKGPNGKFEPDYPRTGGLPEYNDAAYQTLADLAHSQPLPAGLPSYVQGPNTQSLVEQAAAPVEKAGGKLSGIKTILSDAGAVKGGEMTIPEFIAEHGTLMGGLVLPMALQYGTQIGASQLAGSQFGKTHPDAAPALSTIGRDAAIGAGLGTVLPIPGVGTLAGGLAGGVVGGLQSLFGHHSSPTDQQAQQENQVWQMLGAYGTSAATLQAVQHEYASLKAVDPGLASGYLAQAVQHAQGSANLPGLGGTNDPTSLMAQQQQVAQLMGPYMAQQAAGNDAEVNAFLQAATPSGQKVSAATQHLGDMFKGENHAISNSYVLQAEGAPLLQQMSSSIYGKGLNAQAGSGGSGSLASLLTQSGPTAQAHVTPALTATNYGANNQLLLQ